MKKFLLGKKGSMTVEWVAIAAAVAMGAIAITWATLDGLDPVALAISSNLSNAVTQATSSP